MNLYGNANPGFCNWVVRAGLLQEPFVLVDAGCQNGFDPRWERFGDYLHVYGFDPLKEVIDELTRDSTGQDNIHYFWMGLDEQDGERVFHASTNKFETSLFETSDEFERFTVACRALDSLWQDGTIPPCDYVKLDCEGAEWMILRGARAYLCAAPLLAVESETNFNNSPVYPRGHYVELAVELAAYELLTVDMQISRVPRAAALRDRLAEVAPANWLADSVGRPATLNALFAIDPTHGTAALTIDQAIKLAALFEIYGLNDCAIEVLSARRDALGTRFDIERGIDLLAAPIVALAQEEQVMAQKLAGRARRTGLEFATTRFFRDAGWLTAHGDVRLAKALNDEL